MLDKTKLMTRLWEEVPDLHIDWHNDDTIACIGIGGRALGELYVQDYPDDADDRIFGAIMAFLHPNLLRRQFARIEFD